MKAAESKTTATAQHLQAKAETQKPFFQTERPNSVLEQDNSLFFEPHARSQAFFSKPTIQTKLSIGQPGDKYEQEADQMADHVVQRLAENDAQPVKPLGLLEQQGKPIQRKPIFESQRKPLLQAKFHASTPANKFIQTKCAECAAEEETPTVQTQSDPTASSSASPSLESRLSNSRGSGSPLHDATRSQMEGAFGQDFSSVRVHTDSSAIQMNQELSAQAFTHGSDVYFNSGKYDAGSREGQRLLGHELTHVVQQGDSRRKVIQRQEMTPRQIRRDEHIRELAVWPEDAHREWRRLREGERSVLLLYMASRYGADFASDFHRITQLRRRPTPVAYYTNILTELTETHQQLRDRGYRLAGITTGIEHWVHPSGNSINRVFPSRRSRTLQDSESTQILVPEGERQERCADPCIDSTTDVDSCNTCCNETIPDSDPHCRNACHFACAIDLNL